jgi:hypothetical protein
VQAPDTSAIQRLIARAKRRIRGQWALEGATTTAILASAAALWVIFLVRVEAITRGAGAGLLVAAAALIAVGAALKASRRLDDERVARRIDRASGLSDRLSTAIAFARGSRVTEDGETADLMDAAIRDGIRAADRADVARATPFAAPPDLRAAVGFVIISALAAGLSLPTPDRSSHLVRAEPDHAPVGDVVTVSGINLYPGMAVTLGPDRSHPAIVLGWARDEIRVRIPDGAPLGPTTLTAWIGDEAVGPVAFTVIDRRDAAYHKEGSVALEPDDKAYLEALLGELKAVARRDKVPELEDFASQIEQLLKDAELGKISKEQLLDAMAKAEDKLNQNAEPNSAEVNQQLGELGKELAKDQLTKQLGDALQKHDLEKAQQELEKLADKLDKKELSDKDKEQLAKQLDKVTKQLDDKQQKQDQKQDQRQQKLEDEVRRLEKKRDEAKTEKDKLDAERQLTKKQDELKKLQKDQKDKDESAQRQALKRLTKDMQKAAENLQKPQPGQDKQDQEQRDQQASQKLKDAARETGKVDQDQRKQATQKKMSSQMDDLREAMRRAKAKGSKQNQDPFGKQGKNQDFAQRARGQKGQGQAWKPGQGQQPGQGGQGQGQPGQGGQGQGSGGKEWGTGHDDNLVGDPTQKSGNTKAADLQGAQGTSGGGTRETILSAAQKGFASQRYRDVYGKYHTIVEEVMRTEKLPSSYKYYVKRYFAKIHPSTEAPAPAQEATP